MSSLPPAARSNSPTPDPTPPYRFAARQSVLQVEEGTHFAPKFDANGLIPVITTDWKTGVVLMHGYMNRQALLKTLALKEAVYYSRSRQTLWHKGAHSGLIQKVKQLRVDDDQDALWLSVEVVGGASCHVGYRSCFYRSVTLPPSPPAQLTLRFEEKEKMFDPQEVYRGLDNPTQL